MNEFLVFWLICAAVSAVLTIGLRSWRPIWSRRRVVMLSALPVPLIVIALCLYIYVSAALASKEACGVDACGMAMMAATFVAAAAVTGIAVGFGAGALVLRLSRKS